MEAVAQQHEQLLVPMRDSEVRAPVKSKFWVCMCLGGGGFINLASLILFEAQLHCPGSSLSWRLSMFTGIK